MDVATSVRQKVIDRLLDKLLDKVFDTNPLRVKSVALNGEGPALTLDIDNPTAEDIRVEKFLLRAFYGTENQWAQPVTLRILATDTPSFDNSYGMQDGVLPAYSRAFVWLGGPYVWSRIMDAPKIEIVGTRGGRVVLQHRMRTRWMRRVLRTARVRTPAERRLPRPTHAPDGTPYAGYSIGIHPDELDRLEQENPRRRQDE